jgi:hypothetical protein
LVVLGSSELLACSCGEIPIAGELLGRVPVVFEGVVIQKSPRLARTEFGWFVFEEWTFRVQDAWKGVTTPTVSVREGYANCTNIYHLGERAIVFAFPHEASPVLLETSKCASPRGTLDEQRAQLGPPGNSFPRFEFEGESVGRRVARHAEVYLLAGVACTHNVLSFPFVPRHSALAYAAAVILGLALLSAALLVAPLRRRKTIAKFLGIVLLLLIVTVFGAGWRFIDTSGYFAHLVERECTGC